MDTKNAYDSEAMSSNFSERGQEHSRGSHTEDQHVLEEQIHPVPSYTRSIALDWGHLLHPSTLPRSRHVQRVAQIPPSMVYVSSMIVQGSLLPGRTEECG